MNDSKRVVAAAITGIALVAACIWIFWPGGKDQPAQKAAGKKQEADKADDRGTMASDAETAIKVAEDDDGAPPERPLAAVAAAKTLSGAKSGAIDDRRAAVVRGTVHARDGKPLAGVRVAVREHPQFGSAQSGDDGTFRLAVNGGGTLCFEYEKQGYLSSCRMVGVGWQDFVWLPEVCLVEAAQTATEVALKEDAPLQIARGESVTDEHGERHAAVLVPAGTTAELVMSDGTAKPVESLTVRATEYTVGKNGPKAMPAQLPSTSAYTYAVELGADEATAAGADVRFKKPVFHYVENFLGFPVGIPVPSGYFDKAKGAWIPGESGRIIQILENVEGLADLDVEGKGEKAQAKALKDLGVTDDERRQLATLYKPGQSLWRVPIPHFSIWDLNWGFSPPDDATDPDGDADDDEHDDEGPTDCGSIIDVHNQILGEALSVSGTSYWLHYHSDRVPGRKAARSLRIRLTGDKVPKSLDRVKLEVFVAGQRFEKDDFPPQPNQFTTWVWDGKDAQGNDVHGAQQATVRIAYVYKGVYENVAQFGNAGRGIPISGSRTRQEVEMLREFRTMIGGWDARSVGLGGWTLDVHHAYDPAGRTLYLGDGRRRSGLGTKGKSLLNQGVETIAGGGAPANVDDGDLGDGGPATAARLESANPRTGAGFARDRYPEMPRGLAVAPDGTVFVADENRRIRKITRDGIISTVAGGGSADPFKGGPALEANLDRLAGLALGPDGSLYLAMPFTHCVMKVDSQGMISTFAGSGFPGDAGDNGPATAARLEFATGVGVGPDGSVYIADQYNHRIRRVWPNGTFTTVAGTGKRGSKGDGGPAVLAELYWPTSLAIGDDGSVYFTDQGNYVVRRISPAGVITTVAGTRLDDYKGAFEGDGGPALAAKLNDPTSLALGPGGVLYIADTNNHRIRRVGPDGTIGTFAGAKVANADTGDFAGDGGPALQALFSFPSGLALTPEGALLIHDAPRVLRPLTGEVVAEGVRRSVRVRPRVRRVAPPMPGFDGSEIVIPSDDGSEIYRFSATGQHLETRSTLTKAVVYRFGYDRQGRLARIEDGPGNATIVQRSGDNDLALLDPYGQRTRLGLDKEGFLASVQAPGQSAAKFAYANGGLLATYTDAAGSVFRFDYDELGRLTRDSDPAGGFKSYTRRDMPEGFQISGTSAAAPGNTWTVERRADGGELRLHQCGCGALTRETVAADGTRKINYPDGSQVQVAPQPDPRFGAQVSLPREQVLTTPSGKKLQTQFQRAISLSKSGDPLSLERITDTMTINGVAWLRTYDAATRRWTTRSPAGRETRITIDEHRRPVLLETPGLHPVAQTYDARGRLASVVQGTGADARSTTLAYDDQGRLVAVTDTLKRAMRFAYDAAGRVETQTLPDGREIGFAYEAAGRLTKVVPPGRAGHSFEFSPVGLATAYTPPEVGNEPGRTNYEYNLERQLSKIVHPDGSAVELAYNEAGRLETLVMPGHSLKLEFDPKSGQLKSIASDAEGAVAYDYDGPLVTVTTWKGPVEGRVARTFDNNLRIRGVQVNDTAEIGYEYDPDGLPVKAGALTLTRDPASGGLRATKLDNVTTAHEVNGFGESTKLSAAFNDSELFSAAYERDALGRITRKIESIEGRRATYEYRYDAAGRIAEVLKDGKRTAKYEYDANGNRSRVIGAGDAGVDATYDGRDRLVQYGKTRYRYNSLGQLAAKTLPGKEVAYNYDPLGNLRVVALAEDKQVDYVVDASGRRIGKRINGAQTQGFLYREKVGPLAELDAQNRVVSRFVYADQSHIPEYLEKEGTRFRIVADFVGSPRCVVNAATGQIVQRLDYDPFGQVESDTNPAFQPFGFAGGLYDPDVGLTRMGFRDYDAEAGRWTSTDPLGFAGGDSNLYAYVRNNPPNRNDPWGLSDQFPVFTSGTGGGIVVNIVENRVPTTEERLNRTLRQAGAEEAARQNRNSGGGFSPVFNIGNTGATFAPGTVSNTRAHAEHDGTETLPGIYEDDARGANDRQRNPHEPPCETTYGGTIRIRF